MSPTFQVLDGDKDKPGFVCTFCASKFPTRADLDLHWERDPRCRKNKNASNATQSKYLPADTVATVHGEATLQKIRAKDCIHPIDLRQELKNAEEVVIGWQCSYCYSQFGLEVPVE